MRSFHTQYISEQEALCDFCSHVAEHRRIGLDTEFVGEDTFVPNLELIQVSTASHRVVIDCQAVTSLAPLADFLRDPAVTKIVHAGRQDLELLNRHVGDVPTPVFDTQLAAAMVGYGAQVGYAQLVNKVLGKQLAKSHTLTNWSQRPLTSDQITYALADVEFLLPLHDHLHHRLEKLGRLEWVREEFARLVSKPIEESQDPRQRYERIKGWDSLKPKSLAVLRELAAWREEEARKRNVPRGRIVRDDTLMELARQRPANQSDLRSMRGLSASLIDRYGQTLLTLIRTGLAIPESQRPKAKQTPKPTSDAAGRIDLLQAVLKSCAKKAAIAPTLLATTLDLQTLVEANDGREQLDLPILKGWRRELAGDMLLRVLDGDAAVGIDPHTGVVQTIQREK